MNVIVLVGNVATDPELRHTSGGKPVVSFRLAISRTSGSGADFLTVVAWERQAEICKEYLQTGRRIAVEGRVRQSTWQADGEQRSRIEVVAHRIELLGGPRRPDLTNAPDLGSTDQPATADPAGEPTEPTEVPLSLA